MSWVAKPESGAGNEDLKTYEFDRLENTRVQNPYLEIIKSSPRLHYTSRKKSSG
jgi:hypothetical protein